MANSSVTLAQIRAGTAFFEKDGSTTAYGPLKAVQQALYLYGYYPGSAPDGKYGDGTESAVKGFQNEKGLTVNGRIDKATLASLESWAETITDDTYVAPSLARVRNGLGEYTIGHSGYEVNYLKTLLVEQGYSSASGLVNYDNNMATIVKQFQIAVGLSNDGRVGQKTLAALEDSATADWLPSGAVKLTAGKLARAGFLNILLRRDIVTLLNNALNAYGINTKQKVRFFLAQCAVETGWGTSLTEHSYRPGTTGSAGYAPFYGAGLLQITGTANYTKFQTQMANKGINDSKITTPNVYATQHVAIAYPGECAGCVWTGINSRGDNFNNTIAWSTASVQTISDALTTGILGSGASSAQKAERKSNYDTIAAKLM